MKKGWITKKLGDVMDIQRGGSPRPIGKHITDSPDGINWIKISDATVSNKYIYETQQKITQEASRRSRLVHEGDFLLSNSMSFGRPYIMKTTGCIHDGWLVLRNKPGFDLDKDFLYHLLSSPYVFQQFDKLAAGATVRNLNIGLVSSVVIPIPPVEEQQRIVALLDETFVALNTVHANAERNQANAREIFESELIEIIAGNGSKKWEIKRLGDVADHSLGKMLDKSKNRGNYQKYLRNVNVRWFDFDLSDVAEMRFLKEETEKYTAQKGDLMICEGGYPGRAAIWQDDYPIYFQKAIHRVRFENLEVTKWFLYCLYASDLNGKLKGYLTGTGIQHFTGQALDRFEFPIPSHAEICSFIERFDKLSAETMKLEEVYQTKVDAVEELRKSILQKAFEGSL